jgi:quinol monooxygenase YgiN
MAKRAKGRTGTAATPPAPDQVTVLAQVVAKPGHEDAVRQVLLDAVEPTREEAGNLNYDVHEHKSIPGAFYTLSNWTDDAPLNADGVSPHFRTLVMDQAAPDLVASPTLTRARMLSAPEPDAGRSRPVGNKPDQVTLIPFFTIKPGYLEAVRGAQLSAVEPTRAEPGNLDYDLYQSLDDPSVLFFYENWVDQSVLDEHMTTPTFQRVVRGEVDGRLVVPWSAHSLTMISEPA